MFDVDALKDVRLKWFREDVADWFPIWNNERSYTYNGLTIRLMRNVKSHDGEPYDLDALPVLNVNRDLIPNYKESTFIVRLQHYACGLDDEVLTVVSEATKSVPASKKTAKKSVTKKSAALKRKKNQ
ncbi:hypothetical protein [Novipirellula aureliae]|nr:hypothetical protein [Novipirellula aureliae]